MDLYDRIDTARQFTPDAKDSVPVVDRSGQAAFALEWAARQTPAAPEPIYVQPAQMPIPN